MQGFGFSKAGIEIQWPSGSLHLVISEVKTKFWKKMLHPSS